MEFNFFEDQINNQLKGVMNILGRDFQSSLQKSEQWIVFSHSSELAGAELSLSRLLEVLSNSGVSITVCLPQKGPLEDLIRDIDGISIVYFKNSVWMTGRLPRLTGLIRLIWIRKEINALRIILQRKSYNFVLVNTSLIPGPLIAGFSLDLPTGVIVHESISTNPDLKSLLPKKWIIKSLKKYSVALVAVSHFVSKQLRGGEVHYPDIGPIPASAIHAHNIRETIATTKRLRAVMVARISRQKGQYDAIRAVSKLLQRGVEIELDLYGPSGSTELHNLYELINQYKVSNWVRYQGSTQDSRTTMANYDVSLVLSRHESYGRVAAESIQIGVPVIGYAVEGTKEILEHGGGILVRPDSDELLVALESLVRDPEILKNLTIECSEIKNNGKIFGSSEETIKYLRKFSK